MAKGKWGRKLASKIRQYAIETSARLRFLVYGDHMSSFTTLQMITGTCVCCCCFRILQRMTVSHLTSIKIWS